MPVGSYFSRPGHFGTALALFELAFGRHSGGGIDTNPTFGTGAMVPASEYRPEQFAANSNRSFSIL
tara:strand:- start:30 stop:227 length:198 start_codon:yes stop_codon:yes gene_type:complete